MNSGGIFPKWIEPFDTWHLRLLPPILIGLALVLVLLPSHPKSSSRTDRTSSSTSPTSSTTPFQQPLPTNQPVTLPTQHGFTTAANTTPSPTAGVALMRPSRIESPSQNALFWRDRLGDLEGTAEPGSLVRLFLGDKLLSQSTASADGRFRFRLLDFPAGGHTVRVIATLNRTAQASEPVTFLVKSEATPRPAAAPSPRKVQPHPVTHPKLQTPVKNPKPAGKKERPNGRNP